MSHRLLPTSNGRGRGAGRQPVTIPLRTGPPPKPPAALTGAERTEWNALWSSAAAVSWLDEDAPLVLRLIRLRGRAEAEGARWQVEAVRQLEDRLLLNGPRGRQRAGLPTVEPEPSATSGRRNGQRRITSRERERLLRG